MAIRIESSTDTVEQVEQAMSGGAAPSKADEKPAEEAKPEAKAGEEPAAASGGGKGAPEAKASEEVIPPVTPAVDDSNNPKGPKWFRDALKELSKANNDLRKELAAKTKPAATSASAPEPSSSTDAPANYSGLKEPKFEDFKDAEDPYAAFAKATAKFEAAESTAKANAERQATANEVEGQKAMQAYIGRVPEAKDLYPDFDAAFKTEENEGLMITPAMRKVIFDSPVGPHVAYYLAKNPDLAADISAMDGGDALVSMGEVIATVKLQVASLKQAKAAAAKGKDAPVEKDDKGGAAPTPPKKTTTSAPQPIAPVPPAPGPKTLKDIAGPADNVGVDIKFSSDYERQRTQGRRGTSG